MQTCTHEFSGGQRQRIAIARALILNPNIIVLDEPVSSIDVSMRSGIMNLLKDLSRRYGISYVLVAHDFSTIRYLSHEVATMYIGQIVEKASAAEVCSRSLHPYTQGLLAAGIIARPGQGIKAILRGEVGSPINPPPGCRFHPRCPLATEFCKQVPPMLEEVLPGRKVACHLYKKGQTEAQVYNIREQIAREISR
jgi:oligopeptide/dipeptide ABC transporter ATP-binding protein